MGWFTKKEHTHFIRDTQGNVIKVERTGDHTPENGEYKKSDQLLREYKQEQRDKRRLEMRKQRQEERDAYQKAYREARLKQESRRGRMAGSRKPFSSGYTFDTPFNLGPSTSKKKKKKKRGYNNFDFNLGLDPFDNWGFLK